MKKKLLTILHEQGTNFTIMKSLIKQLTFDQELVQRIKEIKTDKDLLYIHLISGKITLREYLAAI